MLEGTDPLDRKSYCFNPSATVSEIFETTNSLTCTVLFGTNEIVSAVSMTNRQYEVHLGHLVTTNGEYVTMRFWDDANSNAVWEADETCATVSVRPNGHDFDFKTTLPKGPFDRNGNGLLDWWEQGTGLSALEESHRDCDDNDHDGLINLHEYWAGCDPLTPDGSNTVLSVMSRSVDQCLEGGNKDQCLEKFVNYISNGYADTFVINTNFWLRHIDTSCASPWQSNGAKNCWAGTLITSRHMIGATHHTSGIGHWYTFVGKSGSTYRRQTIAATNIITSVDTDIRISLLDSPLPVEDVTPASFLPTNYYTYIRTAMGIPMVCFDKEEKALVQDVGEIAVDGNGWTYIYGKRSTNGTRAQFWESAEGGDSGNPRFFLIGNSLALVNVTWKASGFSGSFLTAYVAEIQAAADLLLPTEKHPLRFVDLSLYDRLNKEDASCAR